jgi:hypothetical protein
MSDKQALAVVDIVEAEDEDEADFTEIQDFASILKEAQALERDDTPGATIVMRKAAAAADDFTSVEVDLLVRTIAKKIGIGLRVTREAWKKAVAEAKERAWKAAAAARAAADVREAEEDERRREEERERIWASCGALAEDPKLLDEMEKVAHQLGLVNEGAAARGVFLTYVSRLLAGNAVRMLRLGASASGKNIPVELTLSLIPKHAVVQVSGASPRALPYYGGDDPDALKGKVIYVPEARILASKDGEFDNPFTAMFRTLISEGRIVYQTVVTDADGSRHTETIVKNGPTAAILTCVHDIDPEMKTRVLIQETDESGEQTDAIVRRILSKRKAAPALQPWLDLQLFLEDGAPYRVDIPFREAISEAFDKWRPGFLKDATMRMRRDVPGFLVAVEASAVLHKAQRTVDADGVIIATLDDYRHAYEAFGEGLAAVHGKASEKVIAVVKVIEGMRAESDMPAIKVTLRDLAKRLRVGSPATAKARLDAALEYGAVEQDDALTGRGGARWFHVVIDSKDIQTEPGLGVFPPPEIVAKSILAGGGGSAEQTEQKTGGEAKVRF